jgi:hypothetical protein
MDRGQGHETTNKISYIKGKIIDSDLSPLLLIGFGNLNALANSAFTGFYGYFFFLSVTPQTDFFTHDYLHLATK